MYNGVKKRLPVLLTIMLIFILSACGSGADSAASGQMYGEPKQEGESVALEETVNAVSIDMNSEQVKLLTRLENAYNNQDIYAVIECFDPMITNAFYAGIKLLGVDADAIKGIMPFASKLIAQSGMTDSANWGSVEFVPLDYSTDGLSGTITYQVNLSYADGSSRTLEDTASIVNVDGKWYFASFQPMQNQVHAPIPIKGNLTDKDVEGGLFTFKENGYVGYVNESGEVIIEPYFHGGKDSEGRYCPVKMDWAWGFIDVFGNIVVEYGFEDVGEHASEGYWPVKMNGKWGYINLENGNIISCNYSECGCFSDGIAPVSKDGYWGAIDEDGTEVIDFIYDKMTAGKQMFNDNLYRELSFVSGVIGVEVNGAVGVIDSEGNYLIPLSSDSGNVDFIGDDFVAIQKTSTSQAVNDSRNYLFRISTQNKIPTPEYFAVIGAIGNTIYLHSAIGSGMPGVNAIAIDVEGNIILDTVQSIYSNMGIDTGYYPHVGFGASWFLDHETWLFHNWTLIYIHIDGSGTVIGNFVNDKGELMFPVWMTEITFSDSFVAGYSVGDRVTYLYDSTSGEITEYPECYVMGGNNFLIKSYEAQESLEEKIVNIRTGETLNVDIEAQESDSALIVTDGIFYGLYTVNGFVGDGMKYNKIEYHDYADEYVMELGAVTERYRIGRDGTINKID